MRSKAPLTVLGLILAILGAVLISFAANTFATGCAALIMIVGMAIVLFLNYAAEIKEIETRKALQTWLNQQGHNRCWYYPEIFHKLCELHEVKMTVEPKLPPKEEFEIGCNRYQEEEYTKSSS